MHFRQPRRKVKNTKKICHSVLNLYPECSWVLKDFLPQFTKDLTQFVVLDWLQSYYSISLHCASLLAHSLPQSEAPSPVFISFSLCFTSSHVMSTTTGWRVYNHNISITVKGLDMVHLRFKTPPKENRFPDICNFFPTAKLHGIPLWISAPFPFVSKRLV